jgi:hypothetical protein
MKKQTLHRLELLFASLLATGSLGGACGPCDPEYTSVMPRLPPANPGGTPPPAFDPLEIGAGECARYCGTNYTACDAVVLEGNLPAVECVQVNECGAGRRPRNLRRPRLAPRDASATWLAQAAHLEAASVHAFERLATELLALGAPAALVVRARRAARDELRHARIVGRLAERRGALVPPVRVGAPRPRDAVAIALENATEGCVGEAFAALVARHQARHAAAPALRRSFERIARDEAAHAALAYDVDAWLHERLTSAERARVARARARAARRLGESYTAHASARHELGLPSPAAGRELAVALGEALGWSSAARSRPSRAARAPS